MCHSKLGIALYPNAMTAAPTPESLFSQASPAHQGVDAKDPMDPYKLYIMDSEQSPKYGQLKSFGEKEKALSVKELDAAVAAIGKMYKDDNITSASPPSRDTDGKHITFDLIDNMHDVRRSSGDGHSLQSYRGGRSVTSRRSNSSRRSSMSRRKRGPSLERVIKTTILEQVASFDESQLGEDDPTHDSNSSSTDFILQDLVQVNAIIQCEIASVRSGTSRSSCSHHDDGDFPSVVRQTVDLLPPIESVSVDELGEHADASRTSESKFSDANFEIPKTSVHSSDSRVEKRADCYSPSLFTSEDHPGTPSGSPEPAWVSAHHDLEVFRPEEPGWTTFGENPFKVTEWPEEDVHSVHSPASVAEFEYKLHSKSAESTWSRASDCRSKASF